MPDDGRVLVIGEALVDEVRQPGGEVAWHPGGSPANVAVGLARLERATDLWCSLGDDEHGRLIRGHVELSGAKLVPTTPAARTSVATATLDSRGVASYAFDLEWALAPVELCPEYRIVHTGSVAAVLDPGAQTVEAALRRLRSDALITYDPNARPALMGAPEAAARRIEGIVTLADVVKASSEDIEWLYPGAGVDEIARRWLSLGPSIVIVTLGDQGCFAATTGCQVHVDPISVTVADTVGAGDSFMAALIDGMWAHGFYGAPSRQNLAQIPQEVLIEILDRCAVAAAITVSRAGANPPSRIDLERALTQA